MTHLKKYWLWYLIAIVVVVAVILAYSNWETVKGWFSSSSATQQNVLDANGNPTGQRVYVSSTARQRSCCSVGNTGFIGNCNYPIRATDNIPSCGTI